MARITLNQFDAMYLGKIISGWSNKGGQCVDEVRRYIQKCLIGSTNNNTSTWIGYGNAHDFYRNANPSHFRKVRNSASYVPRPGTICVLDHGYYGHVFIVRKGSTDHLMYSLDQNWSWPRHVTHEAHRYVEIVGFCEPLILYPKAA